MNEVIIAVATTNLVQIEREESSYSFISKTTIQHEGDEPIVAYVKILEEEKLIAELVCAIIGRRLELPIPQPFIVIVPNALLPEEYRHDTSTHVIAFGSKDAESQSLTRRLNRVQNSEITEQLMEFPKTKDVAAFDEWVANWDRNHDNILFGGDSLFQFIDHGEALEPSLKPENAAMANQLLDLIRRYQIREEIISTADSLKSGILSEIPKTEMATLCAEANISKFCSAGKIADRINFLDQRIFHILSLIETRLQIPQTRLL